MLPQQGQIQSLGSRSIPSEKFYGEIFGYSFSLAKSISMKRSLTRARVSVLHKMECARALTVQTRFVTPSFRLISFFIQCAVLQRKKLIQKSFLKRFLNAFFQQAQPPQAIHFICGKGCRFKIYENSSKNNCLIT